MCDLVALNMLLNLLAALSAFAAAGFWLASAMVKEPAIADTYAGLKDNPERIVAAFMQSARLNGKAAIFAAMSAVLWGATTIVGMLI